ncbi:MAG TPA: hypothetical protein VHE55_14830 [Fimbriimonadaceae bacterium]|nr:hypothetical protein [Fimbriimonadaceae bacterium]
MQHSARGRLMALRRKVGIAFVVILICAILYLPIRRQILDWGWIPAATFRSPSRQTLTLYDDGRYVLDKGKGTYKVERFLAAPWISAIRLDSGKKLYIRYSDQVYRVEDIREMDGADVKYIRE